MKQDFNISTLARGFMLERGKKKLVEFVHATRKGTPENKGAEEGLLGDHGISLTWAFTPKGRYQKNLRTINHRNTNRCVMRLRHRGVIGFFRAIADAASVDRKRIDRLA